MKKLRIIIALLSVTIISAELVWIRIFSAEYFYTFAFLVLSVAVLGMGLGGLALRLFPKLNTSPAAFVMLILCAAAVLSGPPAVIKLQLDFTQIFTEWEMFLKIAGAVIILGSGFFFGGTALAYFFRQNSNEMPGLYMADLIGAGTGVLLVVLSMNYLSTPVTVFLAPLPVLAAAMLYGRTLWKIVPVLMVVSALYLSFNHTELLNSSKPERAPVIYTHWDAMSKIKVYEFDSTYRGINVDNASNSPVYQFDGNWDRPDSMKFDFGIDVSYLINKFDSCSFLSLGAGGGTDVLQALQSGACEVYAVEVNPHINYLMQHGELAEFSGNIYSDPRVKVITEDARTFIKRYNNKFDLIYSLSSNTFAALASGSFALAENYLFTKEAFADYWNSLSENGFMMMEHQFYIPRLTSELVEALIDLNIRDYRKHFAVYKLPRMRREMILLSKRPLDEETMRLAFGDVPTEAGNFSYLLYPAHDSLRGNIIERIAETGWRELYAESETDISPAYDNKPFTAQLGLWKNFRWDSLSAIKPFEFTGFPLSRIIILLITGIILFLVIPLNLLPYIKKGEKLKAAPWLYFFFIGAAFMSAEVILIQKFSLYIGASVYSIISVLIALLAGSGIGSMYSRRFSDKTAFTGIIVMLLLNITLIPWLLTYLVNYEILYRVIISVIIVLPLGFFMGMPFPKAAVRVGGLIDWGFAVNGAASVLGSVLILYFAFSYGYITALLLAGLLYSAAYFLLPREELQEKTVKI
jgi:predicted membrane-bound spermidine synthase